MTTTFLITTVVEVLIGAFIIWGVFHEDRLINLEDRLLKRIRIKLFGSVKNGRVRRCKSKSGNRTYRRMGSDSNCA